MNRAELVQETLDLLGKDVPKKLVEEIIRAEEQVKMNALARGENVQLIGFGSYKTRQRNARVGRNPQTGAEINIPAKVVAYFDPSKRLDELLN